jgi:hypothetical protein
VSLSRSPARIVVLFSPHLHTTGGAVEVHSHGSRSQPAGLQLLSWALSGAGAPGRSHNNFSSLREISVYCGSTGSSHPADRWYPGGEGGAPGARAGSQAPAGLDLRSRGRPHVGSPPGKNSERLVMPNEHSNRVPADKTLGRVKPSPPLSTPIKNSGLMGGNSETPVRMASVFGWSEDGAGSKVVWSVSRETAAVDGVSAGSLLVSARLLR